MERYVGLCALGGSEAGEKVVTIVCAAEEIRIVLDLLLRIICKLGLNGLTIGFFFGRTVDQLIFPQAQVVNDFTAGVFSCQRLHDIPVGSLILGLRLLDPLVTNSRDVTARDSLLKPLTCFGNIGIRGEFGDQHSGRALLSGLQRIRLEDNDLSTKRKRSTHGTLEPLRCLA